MVIPDTSKVYFWQDVFVLFVNHELTDKYLFTMMCKSMLMLVRLGNGLQNSNFDHMLDDVWEQYLMWPAGNVPDFIVVEPFFQKLIIPAKVNNDYYDIQAIRYIYLMGWNDDFKQKIRNHQRFDDWILRFQRVRWNHEGLKTFVQFLFSNPCFQEVNKKRAIVELETISNDLRLLFRNREVAVTQLNEAIEYFQDLRTQTDFPCAEKYKQDSKQYSQLEKHYLNLVVNIFSNFRNMIMSFSVQTSIKSIN